jgi:hypothetical protein
MYGRPQIQGSLWEKFWPGSGGRHIRDDADRQHFIEGYTKAGLPE